MHRTRGSAPPVATKQPPSEAAQQRLADGMQDELDDIRVLADELLFSLFVLDVDDADVAGRVVEGQQERLERVEEALLRRVAAAVVERETEAIVAEFDSSSDRGLPGRLRLGALRRLRMPASVVATVAAVVAIAFAVGDSAAQLHLLSDDAPLAVGSREGIGDADAPEASNGTSSSDALHTARRAWPSVAPGAPETDGAGSFDAPQPTVTPSDIDTLVTNLVDRTGIGGVFESFISVTGLEALRDAVVAYAWAPSRDGGTSSREPGSRPARPANDDSGDDADRSAAGEETTADASGEEPRDSDRAAQEARDDTAHEGGTAEGETSADGETRDDGDDGEDGDQSLTGSAPSVADALELLDGE